MTKNTIINIENLSRTFRLKSGTEIKAVNDVNLEVSEGEFLAIKGTSGSGKTTLLNMLGGLDKPTVGKITVDQTNITNLKETELASFRREKVGFVFQAFNLIQTFTAIENVEAALAPVRIPKNKRLERSKMLLESVGLNKRINHLAGELSAGEQQRVAIARAFANEPKILLLDEPTGNLDTNTGKEILKICHRANKENGKTIVAVTHAGYISEYTDRLLNMKDGKLQPAI
jgi:putative ABC transport system ATP-binding protein